MKEGENERKKERRREGGPGPRTITSAPPPDAALKYLGQVSRCPGIQVPRYLPSTPCSLLSCRLAPYACNDCVPTNTTHLHYLHYLHYLIRRWPPISSIHGRSHPLSLLCVCMYVRRCTALRCVYTFTFINLLHQLASTPTRRKIGHLFHTQSRTALGPSLE
ncbi:hypothetical protein LZ30DRAFT_31430 [Colletotrichum cereale]|nr:hypothetical protein LZ30DRAFT_31430 [Colletotrichum cereale]